MFHSNGVYETGRPDLRGDRSAVFPWELEKTTRHVIGRVFAESTVILFAPLTAIQEETNRPRMRGEAFSGSYSNSSPFALLLRIARVAVFLGILAVFPAWGWSIPSQAPASAQSPVLPAGCPAPALPPERVLPLLHALETHPSSGAYNALGALYGQTHNSDCAIASFEKALNLEPHNWQTHYNLALALLSKNHLHHAASKLAMAVKERPDSYMAHNALGLVLGRLGQLDKAAQEFKTAHGLKPDDPYASLNLAEADMEQKRYAAAVYYLKQGLALSPPKSVAYRMQMDLGVAYSENGQYGNAAGVFKQMIAEYPRSALLRFNLATSDAHHEDYVDAAREYKHALDLDPSNDVTRLSLAKALIIVNQVRQALPYAFEYTRREPGDAEGYVVLGQAYRKLGQFQKAAAALQQAVKLDPDSYDARYNLGFSLGRLGKTQEAIQQIQEAEKLKPNSAEATYELGMLLAKRRDEQAAQRKFQAFQELKVEKDTKEKAGVFNNQGNADLQAGNYHAAAQAYQQAVALDPGNAEWHYNYSLALSDLANHAGQERELEKAVRLDPNLAKAHDDLGLCYLADGKASLAEQHFKAALEIKPQFAEAQNNLGVLYARLGKDHEAIALFTQATINNPQYAQAFMNWGIILASQGHYYQASDLFRKAIQISPNLAAAYTALGEAMVKEGHKRQAIPVFQKIVELQPNSPSAHLNLGIALADTHQLKEALAQFSEAVHFDPNNAVAHYNKARVLSEIGRLDPARQELQTACKLLPRYPAALYLLGEIERTQHHLQQSTALLQKVIALDPGDANAQYILGRNLEDQGRTSEAIQHWRLALRADPKNTKALYSLAQALGKSGNTEAKVYMDRFQALQKQQLVTDRVQTLGNFGLQAAHDHNWTQAVGDYEQAMKLCGACPQSEMLHKNLGLIYSRKGDVANADRELRAALKLNPDDAEARKALEILRAGRNGANSGE
jgi:tetratricopeptide (TPR) repeat protein